MNAVAVFPAAREVRIVACEEPRITLPGQVKLRMLTVGVCGTDRDLCAFKFGTPPAGCDHFVLGHESLAEVVEAGPECATARPGDLAVVVVRKPCDAATCTPCREGRQDFCATGGYRERGIKELHGFMTGMVIEDHRYIHILPPELRQTGVLLEPLTIAEKAFLQFRAIEQRLPWPKEPRTALVLGAGPVGLLGAMLFRHAGFATWVYSREPLPNPRAEIAGAAGAGYVCSEETTPRQLAELTGNIDVVYEAMGAPQLAFDVLEVLGANGVFLFTGVPPASASLRLDPRQLLWRMVLRNQVIAGTVNAGADAFQAALRDLAAFERRWPQALRMMITGRYPLEGFRDAIFSSGGIKNVIDIG
jgi:threonine dehydrogenase-like Zn-dependent dehydrogenase